MGVLGRGNGMNLYLILFTQQLLYVILSPFLTAGFLLAQMLSTITDE